MNPTADGGFIDPSEVRSEGLASSVGEKRPGENGEDCELVVPSLKKARGDGELAGNMKKVAEIVLVLATMGKIRAGRSPTAAEMEMMAEARGKLAEVCQGFAPKDVFPRDSFGTVIEDLGLSKLREQKLGFRPPKMSIAKKLLLTKRKMEKSEEFSIHSATYSSQRLQTNLVAAAESRGLSHAVRMFPSDKPGHAPGGFKPASSLGHVSKVNATSLPYQLPTSEVRPMVSSGLTSTHLGRDSSSLASPRVERPHFRLDGRLNGSSCTPQIQANSSGDHKMMKTATWSVQPQSASSAKIGSGNKLPAHTSVKIEGAADTGMSRMVPQAATSKPSTTQTTSGHPPSTNQHLQGMNFVQAPSRCNSHNEIGKIIQKLLQPQLPEHPTWTPPSRDYVNKTVICQMCKITINEVDGVLVCDACEKGYHLKCIPCNNQKGIPRGEWHCGKCLALNNGKPLPPKYGRVMRNITAPKVSSNTPAVHSFLEKRMGTLEENFNQQRIIANGNSGLRSAPICTMGSNYTHSASGLKMTDVREIQGKEFFPNSGKMDDKPPRTCPNKLMETSGTACASPVDLSVEKSCEDKPVTESKSKPPAKSDTVINSFGDSLAPGNPQDNDQIGLTNSVKVPSKPCNDTNLMVQETASKSKHPETVINSFDDSQAPGNPQDNDQIGLTNSVEVPSKPCNDTNLMVQDSEKSYSGETLSCNPNDEIKQDEQGDERANPVETSGAIIGGREDASSSSDSFHDVDWIGDVLQVVDDKKYYQSCCINGFVYKVQDHALFHTNNKLMPSKLQAMWEDSKTKSKWVIVNQCYFPGDFSGDVGLPCAPESNEIYDSNHDITIMASLIQGPCEVLPPNKFIEESERRSRLGTGASDRLQPVFLCKWFYDESTRIFQSVSS